MRRTFAYILVWAVATGVTTMGSWLGVRSVLDAGGPQRSRPLSAAEVRRMAPTPAPTTAAPRPRPTPPRTSNPPPPATRVRPTLPRVPSPTPTPGWVRAGDGWGGPSYRRTFRLVGGTVTVVLSRGAVRVVDARPAPGFRFSAAGGSGEQYGGRLEFASSRHVSRLLVSWRDGPYAEVTESA